MPDSKSSIELIVSAAINLHQAGKDEIAIDILQDAIKETPDFVPAHVLLGALFQSVNNFEECEASYRKALELDPINSEALQGLGLFLASQNRFSEAVPFLRAHLDQVPTDEKSIDGIINVFRNLPDRTSEIGQILQKAWQQSRDDKVGARLARYLMSRDDFKSARGVLTSIVANSKTEQALCDLALVCINMGELDDAILYSRDAIKINPSSERAWRYLSQSYFRKRNYPEALEAIEKAIAADPKQPRAWLDKTKVLSRLDRNEEVLDILNKNMKALETSDQGIKIEVTLSRIVALVNLGRDEEALVESEEARNNFAQDLGFYQLTILILEKHEKYDQVLTIIEAAREVLGRKAERLSFSQYQALLCLGKAPESRAVLEKILSKPTEKNIDQLRHMGVALYLRGREKEAEELYRQLISIRPEEWPIITNLGFILIGDMQYSEAERLLLQVTQFAQAQESFSIACCDLAYLYCLTDEFEKAIKMADQALDSDYKDEEAYLRVPVWEEEKVLPDLDLIPSKPMKLGDNALACKVFALWALRKNALALETLASIKDGNLRESLNNFFCQTGKDVP